MILEIDETPQKSQQHMDMIRIQSGGNQVIIVMTVSTTITWMMMAMIQYKHHTLFNLPFPVEEMSTMFGFDNAISFI
jgi:hypothetical protein